MNKHDQHMNDLNTAFDLLKTDDSYLTLEETLSNPQAELLFGEGILINSNRVHVYRQGLITPIEDGTPQPQTSFDLNPDNVGFLKPNHLFAMETGNRSIQ